MNFHKLNWKTSTKLNAHLPSLKKGIEIPTLYFKFLQNLYPTKRKTKSQQFFLATTGPSIRKNYIILMLSEEGV